MLENIKIINKRAISSNDCLKNVINREFMQKNDKKAFYSMEITPKSGLQLNFNEFAKLPLFVALTWIKDDNLKTEYISDSPTIRVGGKIRSSFVVHHLSCYNLSEVKLDEFLEDDGISNVAVVRGDLVNEKQTFLHANKLIATVKDKVSFIKPDMLLVAGGYPDKHPEADSMEADIQYLKKKVESGAHMIITQICFSADAIVEFIKKSRSVGIKVPIVPGLYVPRNFQELKRVLDFTKIKMDQGLLEKFQTLEKNQEDFEKFSVDFMTSMIQDIQSKSPEKIICFHFFSMNDFSMIRKMIERIDFSEY